MHVGGVTAHVCCSHPDSDVRNTESYYPLSRSAILALKHSQGWRDENQIPATIITTKSKSFSEANVRSWQH